MRILNLLFCFMVFGACGKSNDNPAGRNTKPTIVKVMTYNIHHGTPIHHDNSDVQIKGIAAVINKVNPDLVALQEVDSFTARAPFDQAKKLGELTGMYHYFAKTINYQGGAYGIAILSKYPIISSRKIMLPMPNSSGEQRAIALIKIEIVPGQEVYFASTHLDLEKKNRIAQANVLVELSNDLNAPFIFAGDLNGTPQAPEIQILRKGFVSSCVSNCPKTFPSDNPTKTIDYVFLNSRASEIFHSLSYTAISTTQASDHLPLIEYLSMQKQ